ncbi:Hok/Gef family protein [Pantoea sp. AS-PWVM4]|uniref:Hok/Gef family protein n=1 Tax=Pantoea sp. AS-PWVM4 TaxID=1332069 RepID=UPI000563242E|nr:Hok/Gef family protein [Pantoea sp. AS-PWVM4]
MKQHTTIMFVILLILAVTAVILVSRKDLCEIRYRTAVTEVAVSLACETLK